MKKSYFILFFMAIFTSNENNLSANSKAKNFLEICSDFKECLLLAEKGDLEAQIIIADKYHLGDDGIKTNYEKSFFWYLKAAKQGNLHAQYSVAAFLDSGQGVQQDSIKAFTWYYLAAEQGDFLAQEAIGDYYYIGDQFSKDMLKAHSWYSISKENGNLNIEEKIKKVSDILKQKNKMDKADDLLSTYRLLYQKQK